MFKYFIDLHYLNDDASVVRNVLKNCFSKFTGFYYFAGIYVGITSQKIKQTIDRDIIFIL